MSENIVSFNSTCPRGYEMANPFDRDQLAASLRDNTLRLWCNYCGAAREPSDTEKRNIQKLLDLKNF